MSVSSALSVQYPPVTSNNVARVSVIHLLNFFFIFMSSLRVSGLILLSEEKTVKLCYMVKIKNNPLWVLSVRFLKHDKEKWTLKVIFMESQKDQIEVN